MRLLQIDHSPCVGMPIYSSVVWYLWLPFVAYAIGVAEPVSIHVDTYGTGVVSDDQLTSCVREVFPTKPAALIEHLNLLQPIYQKTASYGHFGRSDFSWEATDQVGRVKDFLQI